MKELQGQALENIKYKELEVFISVCQARSIREVARRKNTQPAQISKLVKNLESKLGIKLLDRSLNGVTITTLGKSFLQEIKKIQSSFERLEALHGKIEEEGIAELSIASTSFFLDWLLPKAISNSPTEQKLNLLELPPDDFVQVALRGGYEVCMHLGEIDWPKTWHSESIGHISWGLYCRKNHPLLKKIRASEALKYPFVYPIYWTRDGLALGNDGCPITKSKRRIGHKTATALTAAQIARYSDQLAFLPNIVAKSLVDQGELAKVKLRSWPEVSKEVFLSVKMDLVPQKFFLWLIKETNKLLKTAN